MDYYTNIYLRRLNRYGSSRLERVENQRKENFLNYMNSSNYKVSLKNSIIICTSNYLNENDIRKNIGDPLFFRFDKIIEFKKLNKEAIDKILVKKVNEKYLLLTDEDQDLIDKEKIINFFREYSEWLVNTRQISKLVDEKINQILVEHYLHESSKNIA